VTDENEWTELPEPRNRKNVSEKNSNSYPVPELRFRWAVPDKRSELLCSGNSGRGINEFRACRDRYISCFSSSFDEESSYKSSSSHARLDSLKKWFAYIYSFREMQEKWSQIRATFVLQSWWKHESHCKKGG